MDQTVTLLVGFVGAAYHAVADPERAFEFGLARTLDGIELYVRSRADAAASGPAATPSRP